MIRKPLSVRAAGWVAVWCVLVLILAAAGTAVFDLEPIPGWAEDLCVLGLIVSIWWWAVGTLWQGLRGNKRRYR